MPSFCRHGRLQVNCPICSRAAAPSRAPRPPRPARSRPAVALAPRAAGGLRVSRVERAPEDGYDNALVPGLRASADGVRLADELAFSAARLEELAEQPPGLYGEAARAEDPEEGIWLALLIACVGPGRGDDPWSAVEAARVPWRSGDVPDLPAGAGALAAYREWARRAGGQRAALGGQPGWAPERRFARALERLALPGVRRGARFEFLVSVGALGLVELAAGTLALGRDPRDPVEAAAKRVLGIGDAINLERRAAELAAGVRVPLAALDLAFANFAREEGERATMGARRGADPALRAAIGAALGVG